VVSAALATRDEIFDILDTVKDPEVPVLSVVELGIVRDVSVDAGAVTVTLTPTYSGCPAMRVIEDDITAALVGHGLGPVRIDTVYAPAWTTDWLSDEAKRKLEAYGIAPPGRTSLDTTLVSLTRAPTASASPRCPYCQSQNTVVKSEFGSTACKSICFCNACSQPFEMFKAL
jgi:ring-1,2-phenylacetyl-CoA epoxidase subunit PaaD